MTAPTAPASPFRRFGLAYLLGAVALFLLTVGVAAAFGHVGWTVAVAAAFVGIFAGGGLGLLLAARLPGSTQPGSPATLRRAWWECRRPRTSLVP